jgi:glycosyltransferase involved in cell wall biosynthesis
VKVLWFTNIELPAVQRRLGAHVAGGGWMESLREALADQPGLELAVAAAGPSLFEPFVEEGVTYYHLRLPSPPRGLAGVAQRWTHAAHPDALLLQGLATVRRFLPDLVHVHGSEGPFGLLATARTTPVLISLQGLLGACSRAYFSGIPSQEILRDIASREFLKGRGLVHDRWIMQRRAQRELSILRACHFFAGRTRWDREFLTRVNPHARYYHVDEVLQPEFYRGEWHGPSVAGPFVVYATMGPAPYKGLLPLLSSIRRLSDYGGRPVHLRVGGQVEGTEMWAMAKRAVHRLGLGDVVSWLGPLSAEAIVKELTRADAYVHPSFVENSPNALAEAMIVGVPCVASAVGGVPSLLRSSVEGLLCPPGNVDAWAAALRSLEDDPDLARRLGSQARRRARLRHEPADIARATLDMYADVLRPEGADCVGTEVR